MRRYLFLALPLAMLAVSVGPAAGEDATFEKIVFDDLATELPFQITWSWHAIGIDPSDNVYIVFGGPKGEDSADCALFQYQARTGKRRLLGTLSDAAKAAGNWPEGERIEKGHTALPWLNGRIYIGTMGFHDAAGPRTGNYMQFALNSRGAHLMAYDPKTDRIEDLSAGEPDGVFFPGRGFMCLEAIPDRGLIAALTVPHGDLLLYDPATGRRAATVPGVPEEFGRHVTRVVVPAPNGKVYYMYGGVKPGDGIGHMYTYNIDSGKRSDKAIHIGPHNWNCMQQTSHDGAIYLTTQLADVYLLDPETDSVERIGRLYPEEDNRVAIEGQYKFMPPRVLGMSLSADGTAIYTVPTRKRIDLMKEVPKGDKERGPQMAYGLCRFDLKTRVATRVADVPASSGAMGVVSGTGIRDSKGAIYFGRHGGGFRGLLKVNPGDVK